MVIIFLVFAFFNHAQFLDQLLALIQDLKCLFGALGDVESHYERVKLLDIVADGLLERVLVVNRDHLIAFLSVIVFEGVGKGLAPC